MDLKSILGYSKGSPYANNPYLDIHTPEGLIDMSNTEMDLMGIDNLGNKKRMKAGNKNPYKFEGNIVREIPMKKGGITMEKMFNYIFDDEEEKNIPTAPTTTDISPSEYDKAQKDLGDWTQRKNTNYDEAMQMVTSEDYQNPNRQLYLYGEQPSNSGFQEFGSYAEGRAALENQLELYQTGKTRNPVGPQSTILQAMSVYAPAADSNNPYAYATTVAKHLGVSINTPISQIDTKKWADIIQKVEGNKKGNNPGNLRRIKK